MIIMRRMLIQNINVQSFMLFRHDCTVSSPSPTRMPFCTLCCKLLPFSIIKKEIAVFREIQMKRMPLGARGTDSNERGPSASDSRDELSVEGRD